MNHIYDKEALYRVWLHNIFGISNTDFRKILSIYNSAEAVFNLDENILSYHLSNEITNLIANNRNLEKSTNLMKRFDEELISVLYPKHPDYPEKFKTIDFPPEILYVQGVLDESINNNNQNIAIIGSRQPDSYGKECAELYSSILSKNGFNIISGLARGIDSCAHSGCLKQAGYTVAVLGCGINKIYPRENYRLYMEIIKSGAIITEYSPDSEPLSHHFPERNRLISALADSVLVIEAKKKSGSLITCNHALAQGKNIFAVPGRIFDPLSEGCNSLIYDGAMCTISPQDIIETMNGTVYDNITSYVPIMINSFTEEERKIFDYLSLNEEYIDSIINYSKLGVTKTINTLLSLKEKGVIKEPVKGYYIRDINYMIPNE